MCIDSQVKALSTEETAWFQSKFKALKDIPDSMIGKLSFSTLLQLNEALARDASANKKLEADARMAQNADSLLVSPNTVLPGIDDRQGRIHELWFKGGPACSAQFLWNRAREVLGNDGIPALASYDMDAMGCGGCVTAKAWLELANPAS